MKKWISILFLTVFLGVQFAGNTAYAKAEEPGEVINISNPAIVVNTFKTNKKSAIVKGEKIKIYDFEIENISDNPLDDLYMVIDENGSSSFILKSSFSTIKLTDRLAIGKGIFFTSDKDYIELEYTGGADTRLPITFYYKGGSLTAYLKINAKPDTGGTNNDVDTKKFEPKLSILNSSVPSGKPGDVVNVILSIKNTSSYDAMNVIVTPQINKVTGEPFESDTLSSSQIISKIKANDVEAVTFKLRISEKAVEKTYPLDVNFEFENVYGNKYLPSEIIPETIYIKVVGKEGNSKLIVKDLYYSEPIILAGGSTALTVNLQNTGEFEAKDIKVSLQGLKEDGFTLLSGVNNKYIGRLNPKETTTLSYELVASKKMTKGNYGLILKIDYKDHLGNDCPSEEQQFFIPVEGEETDTKTKTVPKIILEQYSSSPSIVKAGQNFDLNMSFLNTSDEKRVKNIKIYLTVNETSTDGANIFTPVDSSNTFFIDSIAPKGRVSKSLTMYTVPDAKQKTYTLSANFEYEDEEGTEYKATELIGVPVTQVTNVDTSEIMFPTEAFPGQPVPVSFDFYNTGKTLLRNFMIKLEGEFQSQNGNYFVGNFDVGSSDHYEAMLIPNAPGQLAGAVVISFEDPTGQKIEIRKDFAMNVMEMPVQEGPMGPGMGPDMPIDGGAKSPIGGLLIWIGAGVGIIVITVVAIIIIRKRIIRKREEMTLDE